MTDFDAGTPLHAACVAVCLAVAAFIVIAARAETEPHRLSRRWIGAGCLFTWITNASYLLWPGHFSWDYSLPLHFCHLANLLGAIAVLTRIRAAQALIWFWSIGLCSCAFLTPTLQQGPATFEFWSFWTYHLFIPVSAGFVFFVDGFRPGWRDAWGAIGRTSIWMAILALLNAATGWNYGFLGPDTPGQTTILDFLGPYPLRLVSMWIVGALLFLALAAPWAGTKKAERDCARSA